MDIDPVDLAELARQVAKLSARITALNGRVTGLSRRIDGVTEVEDIMSRAQFGRYAATPRRTVPHQPRPRPGYLRAVR